MHQRARPRDLLVGRRALSALLLAVLFCAPARASARHTAETPVTIDSAYTLQRHEWRISVWRLDFGLFERVDLGSYVWPWLFRVPNLHVKSDFLHLGDWTFAARLGFAHLDSTKIDKDATPFKLNIIPFELMGSWRVGDSVTFSLGGVYTKIGGEGSSDTELKGAAAVTNLQLVSTFEWRWSSVTAWTTHFRYLAYQDTSAAATITFQPDAYTKVDFLAAGGTDVLDVKNAWSVVSGFFWSWDWFNLRLAVSYGNWSVPAVNFVLPERIVVPELDVYLRF